MQEAAGCAHAVSGISDSLSCDQEPLQKSKLGKAPLESRD